MTPTNSNKTRNGVLPAVLWSIFAITSAQADTDCPIPYSAFEGVVPHFDIKACPAGMATEEEGFCRISLENGVVTIYEFRYTAEDACLSNIRPADKTDYLFKP